MPLEKGSRSGAMMPENSMDEKIRGIFKSEDILTGRGYPLSACPEDEEIADYISGKIAPDKKERLLMHIIKCQRCLDIGAISLKALSDNGDEEGSGPTMAMIKRVLSIAHEYPRKKTRRLPGVLRSNRYLILAGGFFVLSFIIKRYFIQFLIASGIFGIKWVMDTGSSKALIMIYDAWKSRRSAPHDDSDNDASSMPDSRPYPGSKPRSRI
jgi:hypothetical protein